MVAISVLLFFAGVVELFRRARTVRHNVIDAIVIGSLVTAGTVLDIIHWVWQFLGRFARWTLIYLVVFLIPALLIGNPWLTLFVLALAVIPLFLSMLALNIMRLPVAEATDKLKSGGETIFKSIPVFLDPPDWMDPTKVRWYAAPFVVPFYLGMTLVNAVYLPISVSVKITGAMIQVLGYIGETVESTMRWLVRLLVGVNLGLLFLASWTVFDIQFKLKSLDIWVVVILTLMAMILATLAIGATDIVEEFRARRRAKAAAAAGTTPAVPARKRSPASLVLVTTASMIMLTLVLLAHLAPGYARPIGIRMQNASLSFQDSLYGDSPHYFIQLTEAKELFIQDEEGKVKSLGHQPIGALFAAIGPRSKVSPSTGVWLDPLPVHPVSKAEPEELVDEIPNPEAAPFFIRDGKGYQRVGAPSPAPSTTTTAGARATTPKSKPPVGHFELKPREAVVIPPDKSEIVKGDQLLVDTHAPEGALVIEVGKQKTRAKHGKTVVKVEDPGNIVLENTSTNRIRVTFYLYKDGEPLPPDLDGPDNPLVRFVIKNQRRTPIEVYWKDPSGVEHIYASITPGGLAIGKSWTHNNWVIRDSTDGALIDHIERPQAPFDKTYNN